MAFYGRVTNESKTSMTFDRIYQNRVDMDNNANTDGVFTGRFVLIDYDRVPSESSVTPITTIGGDYNDSTDDVYDYYLSYYKQLAEGVEPTSDDIQVSSATNELILYHVSMVKKAQDQEGKCLITEKSPNDSAFSEYDIFKVHVLKYNGENAGWPENAFIEEVSGNVIPEEDCIKRVNWVTDYVSNDLVDVRYFMIAPKPNNTDSYQFLDITSLINVDGTMDDNVYYTRNYNIDKIKYGNKLGRGYDSTVWRKVVGEDGIGYYVMLAELNSVVPTFDITAEAPSAGDKHTITDDYSIYDPVKPHFDEDTTNIYYNLHMGTPWGFKIKPVTTTINESEEPETDLPTDDASVGAIYVNASGFDRYKPLKTPLETRLSREGENRIKVTPTGISGQKYYDPDKGFVEKIDQQEMQINLPTIGDAIATLWDSLYGNYDYWKDKYIRAHSGEEGFDSDNIDDNDIIRDIEIAWGEASNPGRYNGPRLVSNISNKQVLYTPTQVNNLSGAMHTLYDLIGQNVEILEITAEELAAITEVQEPAEKLKIAIQNRAADTDLDLIYYCINDSKFYFKNYETYIQELDPTNDAATISAGSGYKQFNGLIVDPTGESLYKQPTSREHYYLLGEDDELQPDVTYYSLDLTKFTTSAETTIKDFETLVSEGSLYEFSATNSQDTLTPIDVDDNVDPTVMTVTTPNGTVVPRFYIVDTATPLQIKAYFPSETGLFVNAQNVDINTYPMLPDPTQNEITIANASQCIFYQRIQTNEVSHPINEDGSIDYSRTIYTTVLEPKAITAELAQYLTDNEEFAAILQENGYRIAGLPSIHKWPNTSRDMATGVWTKDENDRYVITTNPPALQSSAVNAKITEVLRGVQTYQLEVSAADNFYEPNSYYWGAVNGIENSDDIALYEVYRKITPRNNDGNPTYKIFKTTGTAPNTTDVPLSNGELATAAIPGVNGLDDLGLDDNSQYTAYFIPGQLYESIGNGQYVAANTYSANTTYYKRREVVVLSDPLGEFNVGEVWNTKLSLSGVNADRSSENKVVLGLKLARPHLYELEGYSRDDNTVNGWILYLNRLLGNTGDEATRDRETIRGLINYLNDRLDKIDNVGENQLVISDSNGHLNGGSIVNTTTQWLDVSVSNPVQNGVQHPQFNIAHATNSFANASTSSAFGVSMDGNSLAFNFPIIDAAGHVVGSTAAGAGSTIAITAGDNWLSTTTTSSSLSITHNTAQAATTTAGLGQDAQPHFGEAIEVLQVGIDDKGHVKDLTARTVTLPVGSLTDSQATGADVITQLALVPSTGALSTTRTNVGALTLSGYELPNNLETTSLTASDSLNEALEKLEYNLNKEVADRNSAIEEIIGTSEDTYQDDTIAGIKQYINNTTDRLAEHLDKVQNFLPQRSAVSNGTIQRIADVVMSYIRHNNDLAYMHRPNEDYGYVTGHYMV